MKSKRQKNQSKGYSTSFTQSYAPIERHSRHNTHTATTKSSRVNSNQPSASSRTSQIKSSKSFTKIDKVLCLDLDNTLVCNFIKGEVHPNGYPAQVMVRGELVNCSIVKRPGLDRFLIEMSKYYRLFIFTVGLREYAIGTLKGVGIKGYFQRILDRDDCFQPEDKVWLKNVELIGEPPNKVVLLDDSMKQVQKNIQNAVPIRPFQGDPEDRELDRLMPFLISIANRPDVRPVFLQYREFFKDELEAKQLVPSSLDLRSKSLNLPSSSTNMNPAIIIIQPATEKEKEEDESQGDFECVEEGQSLTEDNITRKLPKIYVLNTKLFDVLRPSITKHCRSACSVIERETLSPKVSTAASKKVEKIERNLYLTSFSEDINQESSENAIFLEEEEEQTHKSFHSSIYNYIYKKPSLILKSVTKS